MHIRQVLELDRLPERLKRRAAWASYHVRRHMVDWLVPVGLHRATRSARSLLESWFAPADRKAIAELRNRHVGQRCFILACGPSIGLQDLAPLRNEICISTSSFFMHKDYSLIRPQYHCVPNFCSPPHPEAAAVAWFTQMQEAIGTATFITDLRNRRRIQPHGLFQGRAVQYINAGGSWDIPLPRVLDLTRKVPFVQGVVVMALMAALYMGFERIYLMGCDHSWLDHLGESRHFYPESDVAWATWGNEPWGSYDAELSGVFELWSEYRHLRRYAERNGQHIYNATEGGRLDVFERVNYASLLYARTP